MQKSFMGRNNYAANGPIYPQEVHVGCGKFRFGLQLHVVKFYDSVCLIRKPVSYWPS